MDAKEKAAELVERYMNIPSISSTRYRAKQCAMVCVEEIIALRKGYFMCENKMQDEAYWQDVLTELNKL
jgi:hypothetical protein